MTEPHRKCAPAGGNRVDSVYDPLLLPSYGPPIILSRCRRSGLESSLLALSSAQRGEGRRRTGDIKWSHFRVQGRLLTYKESFHLW